MFHFKKIFLANNPFSYITWLAGLALFGLPSCSQHGVGPVNKAYNNLAARDNAYFLARLKMKEEEQKLFDARQEDYNQILPLFPTIDSNKTSGMRTAMEDCIKKCSLPIKWHGNSKWIDDSYVIIGKARFYEIDFPNAIETFKYVNRPESDNDARHEALNWLLYTYTVKEEYDNAFAVADYIRRQPLNEKNKRDFYLAKAYLHQRKKEYKYTAAILELTMPLMKKDERKARAYFILGQIYQSFRKRKEAYRSYRAALKNRPNYELSFFTRLNLLQVVDVADKDNIQKAQARFKKMLKDAKNVDYIDKIYYEMALFEVGLKNYDAAIGYLKKSTQAPSKNPIQKSYSFLKLASIHYDDLQKYVLAKDYYDSTLASLPKEAPEYPAVAQKQKVLDKFVEQLNIVHTEDSLQRLARMDTASLSKYYDKILDEEAARLKLAQREAARQDISSGSFLEPQSSGSTPKPGERWYLYNPAAVSLGKTDFARKWGNRALEDNWRRSKKETAAVADADATVQGADSTSKKVLPPVSEAAERQARKETFFKAIPFSAEALQASNKKLEDAYYNLGKIYDLELNEPKNAITSFDTLLTRFSSTEYKPEVYYFLYLIYDRMQDARRNEYEEKLLQDYPNSTFARLIKSAGSADAMNESDNRAREIYAQAYAFYETGNYDQALKEINQALVDFPKSATEEKFVLLRIFITGKTQPLATYQQALNDFIRDYPTSSSLPRVRDLLKASEAFTLNR